MKMPFLCCGKRVQNVPSRGICGTIRKKGCMSAEDVNYLYLLLRLNSSLVRDGQAFGNRSNLSWWLKNQIRLME
ncbi:UNVERIFIED_CONTAM: hypothetical protein GTU68_060617 [Idotea baltica]|nr:hypothetical protein [Idotea baltica]